VHFPLALSLGSIMPHPIHNLFLAWELRVAVHETAEHSYQRGTFRTAVERCSISWTCSSTTMASS